MEGDTGHMGGLTNPRPKYRWVSLASKEGAASKQNKKNKKNAPGAEDAEPVFLMLVGLPCLKRGRLPQKMDRIARLLIVLKFLCQSE